MLDLRKRREVKSLLREGSSLSAAARSVGISLSSVKRIAKEADVDHLDNAAERRRRRIGRPSKVRPYRNLIVEIVNREPDVKRVELLRRLRVLGYRGGKTAFYSFMCALRAERVVAAQVPAASAAVAASSHARSAGAST